nr:hypothetical protein [uncultured Desulfobacter sp.]
MVIKLGQADEQRTGKQHGKSAGYFMNDPVCFHESMISSFN